MSDSKFANLVITSPHRRWSRQRKKELKRSYLNVIIAIAESNAHQRGVSPAGARKQGLKLIKHIGFSVVQKEPSDG